MGLICAGARWAVLLTASAPLRARWPEQHPCLCFYGARFPDRAIPRPTRPRIQGPDLHWAAMFCKSGRLSSFPARPLAAPGRWRPSLASGNAHTEVRSPDPRRV